MEQYHPFSQLPKWIKKRATINTMEARIKELRKELREHNYNLLCVRYPTSF